MNNQISQSETSKHRARLAPYCQGYGIDIGFGGDPITPNAIRVDMHLPYANTGMAGVQLGGDCRNLLWFADGVLDFVYSSHVLEDFDIHQTIPIMKEWARVLKEGGKLILLQPDQQRYLAYCQKTGGAPNCHHAIDHFSLQYLLEAAEQIGFLQVAASEDHLDEYSFFVVFTKLSQANQNATTAAVTLEEEVKRLRMELARTDSELQDSTYRLERYRHHPVIRWLKVPYLWFRKLTGRGPAAS